LELKLGHPVRILRLYPNIKGIAETNSFKSSKVFIFLGSPAVRRFYSIPLLYAGIVKVPAVIQILPTGRGGVVIIGTDSHHRLALVTQDRFSVSFRNCVRFAEAQLDGLVPVHTAVYQLYLDEVIKPCAVYRTDLQCAACGLVVNPRDSRPVTGVITHLYGFNAVHIIDK